MTDEKITIDRKDLETLVATNQLMKESLERQAKAIEEAIQNLQRLEKLVDKAIARRENNK